MSVRARLMGSQPSATPGLVTPFVTLGLAAALIGAFAWQTSLATGHPLHDFLRLGGLNGSALLDGELYRTLAHLLLHANVAHLAANLVLLLFFGAAIECVSRPALLLVFVASGWLSGVVVLATDEVVSIGASGSIGRTTSFFLDCSE